MIIKEMAKDQRPRERLIRDGKQMLSTAELLAILIGTGSKERSALDLANSILALDERGVGYLMDLTVSELMEIDGVGEAKACRITAAFELAARLSGQRARDEVRIGSSDDVAKLFMEKMRYLKKEFFNVLLLDTKGDIIKEENVSVGDLATSIVHPRESFTGAVRNSAAAVIFVHNHPSGDPSPSGEDLEVTKRLAEAGKILGIRVLDHIIIGDGVFVSLHEQGYI